jgi:hypothetical protein
LKDLIKTRNQPIGWFFVLKFKRRPVTVADFPRSFGLGHMIIVFSVKGFSATDIIERQKT